MAVLWSQILVVIALLSTCLSFQRSGIMGAQRWIQSTSRPSFIPLAQTLLQATESEESALGMPDNMKFAKYYSSIVADGEEMNQMQFLAYEEVLDFLAKGLVYEDDLYDLWLSATGDATGLNLEEAYEMLCMVYDLPDPEDIQFYDEEFQKLSGGTDSLNFNQVLEWKDIQDMISAVSVIYNLITLLKLRYFTTSLLISQYLVYRLYRKYWTEMISRRYGEK